MSAVSPQDAAHLARLARLALSDEERERFAGQLSSIVGYVEQLREVDGEGVDVLKGVTGTRNVLAADAVREAGDLASVDPLALVAAAPRHEGRLYAVRAVMEAGGGA